MPRIELLEKYVKSDESQYSLDWWIENMPSGAKLPNEKYSYRRTYIDTATIERPIEIEGNKKEFIVRFWAGEDLVVKGDYDDFCILLDDIEEDEQRERENMDSYGG